MLSSIAIVHKESKSMDDLNASVRNRLGQHSHTQHELTIIAMEI